MLETLDFFALMAGLGVVSALVMYAIRRHNPAKVAARAGYDSIKTMYETYNTQVQDVLKIKDSQIKRLNAKLQENSPIIDDNSPKEVVNLDSLAPMLQSRGINPSILTNPVISKLIKKYTKGMGIEEILAIVDQFGLLKGNKKSESNDPVAAAMEQTGSYW